MFYILSVKHRNPPLSALVWWGPARRRYVESLELAGQYTEEEADDILEGGKFLVPASAKVPVKEADDLGYAGIIVNTEDNLKRLGALEARFLCADYLDRPAEAGT